MASITIRNLDDDVKTRLRVRAASHGRSMEEEARLILREAVGRMPSLRTLASIIRAHFGPSRGVDLELPSREPIREPPRFDCGGGDDPARHQWTPACRGTSNPLNFCRFLWPFSFVAISVSESQAI